MVQAHCSKQHFCGIGIAQLPDEQSPELPPLCQVRGDMEEEVVFRVSDGDKYRSAHDPKNEELGHRSIGKSYCLHLAGVMAMW